MAETKHTFCRICEAACGLKVTVENNRVLSIVPDAEHPVTKGYACAKGVRFGTVQESEDRLLNPMKRVGDKWEEISWEQATTEIGQKLRTIIDRDGRDAASFYIGSTVVYNFAGTSLQTGFVEAVGSRNVFGAGSQDCNNKFLVQRHMYGSPFRITTPDLARTKFFVCIGANPAISQGTFMQTPRVIEQFKEIEERGGRVIFVNPRRTETAKAVGEQLFVRPDTDVFFLLAFLHELIAQDGVDHAHVNKHMRGYAEVKRVAEPWTPERCAKVTGVDAQAMRQLVADYIAAEGASLYCGTGLNQGSNGTLAFWVLECINAVSGNLDRDGGSFVGHGLLDMAQFLKKTKKLERSDRTRVGNLPSVNDTFPATVMADEMLTPGKGQVKAMFVLGGNPVLTCPNGDARLDRAMKDLELLVCFDLFRNETGNLAHYILPTTTFLERPDLPMVMHWMAGTQQTRYVQYTDRVLEPPPGVREEAWAYVQIALKAGLPMFGTKPVHYMFKAMDVLERKLGKPVLTSERIIAGALKASKHAADLDEMRERYPNGQVIGQHRPGDFLGQRVLTRDGKVDLAPPSFVEDTKHLEADYQRELDNRHQIKVISKRERLTHNSWTHNSPAFVSKQRATNYIYLNPQDAAARKLNDGDMAIVSSTAGEIHIPVKVTEEMMEGAAALPHGWGHQKADGLKLAREHAGENVNLLTPDGPAAAERLSGMSHMTGIVIDVKRAHAHVDTSEAVPAE